MCPQYNQCPAKYIHTVPWLSIKQATPVPMLTTHLTTVISVRDGVNNDNMLTALMGPRRDDALIRCSNTRSCVKSLNAVQ